MIRHQRIALSALIILGIACLVPSQAEAQSDPLPSWNDAATKRAILTFVEGVTKKDSPSFVPVERRVATFDNDGTLWCE